MVLIYHQILRNRLERNLWRAQRWIDISSKDLWNDCKQMFRSCQSFSEPFEKTVSQYAGQGFSWKVANISQVFQTYHCSALQITKMLWSMVLYYQPLLSFSTNKRGRVPLVIVKLFYKISYKICFLFHLHLRSCFLRSYLLFFALRSHFAHSKRIWTRKHLFW